MLSLQVTQDVKRLRAVTKRQNVRFTLHIIGTIISAYVQAWIIVQFIRPAHLISAGFTGAALLLDSLTIKAGLHIPVYVSMILLNIPVAYLAAKKLSKRFVAMSCLQVVLASFFITTIPEMAHPILEDTLLLVCFGGVAYGAAIALALRSGASTAGTDFISLMIMNHTGKNAWGLIFAANCLLIFIFGLNYGWTPAAYSIMFQFISTKTIESVYHRFDRMCITIVTKYPDRVLDAYNKNFHHGSSVIESKGGYSGVTYWMITSVVSSYEITDIVGLVSMVDPDAVMRMNRVEQFVGNFWRGDF